MQLLLDTHAFIWSAAAPQTLAPHARRAIEDPANDVYVSVAAAWEIVMKYGLGKIALPLQPESWVQSRMLALGIKPLPIRLEHALTVRTLPAHHDDPFDRIMVAQAQIESLTLVTRDQRIMKYSVRTMKA